MAIIEPAVIVLKNSEIKMIIKRKGIKLIGLLMLVGGFSSQVFAQEYMAPANTPAHIRAAVESGERTAEETARDINRSPAHILTLADLNQGDTVIELSALGQYYSTIIANAIGSTGNLHMYDLVSFAAFGAAEDGNAFAASHANAEYNLQDYDDADYPAGADAAYLINGYHDLPARDNDPAVMNSMLYAALRPGGKYVVIDHRADDGSGWSAADTIHRIDKNVVVEEVTAAGFELISDSSLLAHPEDSREAAPFSMPGITGRFVLIFQKPY
jgi:predicted methyltransferase